MNEREASRAMVTLRSIFALSDIRSFRQRSLSDNGPRPKKTKKRDVKSRSKRKIAKASRRANRR